MIELFVKKGWIARVSTDTSKMLSCGKCRENKVKSLSEGVHIWNVNVLSPAFVLCIYKGISKIKSFFRGLRRGQTDGYWRYDCGIRLSGHCLSFYSPFRWLQNVCARCWIRTMCNGDKTCFIFYTMSWMLTYITWSIIICRDAYTFEVYICLVYATVYCYRN